jgi:hypothetical protein
MPEQLADADGKNRQSTKRRRQRDKMGLHRRRWRLQAANRHRRNELLRSALGPCRNGQAWVSASPTVTDRSDEPRIGDSPGLAAGMMPVGDSDCGPDGSGLTPRGSRRAATDRREDQHAPWRTMTDRWMVRGTDTLVHLRLSNDPSRSLPVARTGW